MRYLIALLLMTSTALAQQPVQPPAAPMEVAAQAVAVQIGQLVITNANLQAELDAARRRIEALQKQLEALQKQSNDKAAPPAEKAPTD